MTASLAGLALTVGPASAGVVFSEKFEDPVVVGFDENSVPSGGNWIGSNQGFGSSNRGLYNESVSWPATPSFSTPFGAQGYMLNYTNSGLTTAQGATGQTLAADVTYTVTFHAAVQDGTTGSYRVELVAFGAADDDTARREARAQRPGTILASAAGDVTGTDMSTSDSIVFTTDATDPDLGKDLAIRLIKSSGSVIYDHIRLIVGHDLAPSPADGEDLDAGGTVTLSWTNMPPTGAATYVDVWFGTDPGALARVVDGQAVSTAMVNAPEAGTYYWRVDSYPDGDPNGTVVVGDVFEFSFADTDGDGLPDDYELAHTDPASRTALDPAADLDTDDLTTGEEYIYGTDPNKADTDGDTLLDGPELLGVGLRPITSPINPDSDGDGLSDGVESNTGTWVGDGSTDTGTNPQDVDWDNDGLEDGVETHTGTLVDRSDTGTDPFDADTDDDGVWDYYEVTAVFTDPHDVNDLPSVPYPLPDPDPTDTGAIDKPVKVYILSGQSNMVGYGQIGGDGPGTLNTITRTQNRFPNLLDGNGDFLARNDVIYRGVISATGNGPLAPGFGKDDNHIGPELGFGQIMGWYHDEPVLVIKASIGNRGLQWDFLPPGSEQFDWTNGKTYPGYGGSPRSWDTGTTPEPISWYAGKEFDRFFMIKDDWAPAGASSPQDPNVATVLDNFATEYPDWASQGFEIAGFGWFHGYDDANATNGPEAERYEQNMARFIREIRSYLENRYPGKVAPNAPFAATTFIVGGPNRTARGTQVANALLAVSGDSGNYPEFVDNVKTMEAIQYWRTNEESSNGDGIHHHHNAETFMLVGDALGRAMIELVEASAGPDTNPPVLIDPDPANGASGISAGTNLVAGFNESVAVGSGNITLVNLTDGPSGNVVIDVTDTSRVSVSGRFLTIDPVANLATNTQYAVQIDATAIDDLTGNSFAGISDTTSWSFTTAAPDLEAPTLVSTSPANGATGVAVDGDLEATFSEPIAIGSGDITLRNLTDGSGADIVIAASDVTQVTVSGSVLAINPSAELLAGKSYAIRIDGAVIDDLVGNSYGGITDDATWTFSTPAPPPAGLIFSEDFESPATANHLGNQVPDNGKWIGASGAFGSGRRGFYNENGIDFTTADGEQAYGFWYNAQAAITTVEGAIGGIAANTTYTLAFDYGNIAGDTTNPVKVSLFAYDNVPTASRTSAHSDSNWTQIGVFNGIAATSDLSEAGEIIFNSADNPGVVGQDLAIRIWGSNHFGGQTTNAILYDNVRLTTSGGVGGGNSFADWIAKYPGVGVLTGFADDPDKDGIGNGLENYFGTDPSAYSGGLVVSAAGGGTFRFTHPVADTPADDVSAAYSWSKDLVTFHANGGTADGTTVSFSPGTPAGGMVEVSATITGTAVDRLFVVIEATQN